MATAYEWIVEEMDGEDITDVRCYESYAAASAACGKSDVLALRKLKSRNDNGTDTVGEMAWAYVVEGVMPPLFDDGSPIPGRYQAEAKREVQKKRKAPADDTPGPDAADLEAAE